MGILFTVDPIWMGGVIYILNCIHALNLVEDDDKPELIVFYNHRVASFLSQIDYKYIKFVEIEKASRLRDFVVSVFLRRNVHLDRLAQMERFHSLFPVFDLYAPINSEFKIICWIADFQYRYYPQFFTRKRLIEKEIRSRLISRYATNVVFSSQASLDDYRNYYGVYENQAIHTYRFASITNKVDSGLIGQIRSRYGLDGDYYLCSNQWHPHKNHEVVLKAMEYCGSKGRQIKVVFTGKPYDNRDLPHMRRIFQHLQIPHVKDNVIMTGLIDRMEQIALMQSAKAVIQPSFFEGWSTVCEDAMSLGIPLVLSNISVNKEQVGQNGVFFDPNDYKQLADILTDKETIEEANQYAMSLDYKVRRRQSAYDLLRILTEE